MTRGRRVWLIAGVLVLLVAAGWTLAIGAIFAVGGVATVELHDRNGDLDLYLPLPVALLDLAVLSIDEPPLYTAGLGRLRVDGVDVDLGSLGPAVADLLRELDRLPDATFVEIDDGNAWVRVAKRGGKLVIEVDDPGTSLSVSVPTRGAARLATRLLG